MKINIKRIPPEGEPISGFEPPSIIDLADADALFEKEIQYDLFAQIQGHALLVTGKLRTPVSLKCGRCLKMFERSLVVDQFVVHQELAGDDFVDLTDNIREDILLQLPQRALCRENCRGLCPRCGVDLNKTACQCKTSEGDLCWHALDQIKLK